MQPLEFDYEKATQALDYLANREGGRINKLKAVKLIWIADRYHIRKYGRPIINDSYVAMNYGPVGSNVKDIAERNDFLSDEGLSYSDKYIAAVQFRGAPCVKSVKEADLSVFSKTDITALNFAFDNYGHQDGFALAKMSHLYPEWAKFEEKFKANKKFVATINYDDFFSNPAFADDKFDEDDEDLAAAKRLYEENQEATRAWS